MRLLLLNVVVIALAAAVGYAVCAAMNWNAREKEMAFAAIGCLAAAQLGTLPVLLFRASDAGAASQAGLVGTLVHLMVATGFAGAVVMARKPHVAFVYWVMLFYWVSLASVAFAMVRNVRAVNRNAKASPTPASPT